jgi:hypothetical protein
MTGAARTRVDALWTRRPVRTLRTAPPLSRLAAASGRRLLREAVTWDELQLGLGLATGDRKTTLVVPAWSGSVADEVLYWLPFVHWAVRFAGLPPERVVLVAPPERREWYEALGTRSVADPSEAPGRTALIDQAAFLRLCTEFWEGGAIRPVVRHAWYTTRPRRTTVAAGTRRYVIVDARTRLPAVDVAELAGESPAQTVELVAGAAGAIGPWGDVLALALLHGIPSVLLLDGGSDGHEPQIDVAQRYARLTGSSLTVADPSWLWEQPDLVDGDPPVAIRVA